MRAPHESLTQLKSAKAKEQTVALKNADTDDVRRAREAAVLRRAAFLGDLRGVHISLASGIHPNAADECGGTALHVAAARGYVEIVDALLNASASVDAVDQAQQTALMLAVNARLDSLATLKLLLVRGADTRRVDVLDHSTYAFSYKQTDPLALVTWKCVGREQSLSKPLKVIDLFTTAAGRAVIEKDVQEDLEERARERTRKESARSEQRAAKAAVFEHEEVSSAIAKQTALEVAVTVEDYDATSRLLEERRQRILLEGQMNMQRVLSEAIGHYGSDEDEDELEVEEEEDERPQPPRKLKPGLSMMHTSNSRG